MEAKAMSRGMLAEHNMRSVYKSVAIYYEESDSVEYVRYDVSCVYRRVDELLTLVLRLDDRSLVGFRFKGFKHFYLNELRQGQEYRKGDFILAVSVLEKAMEKHCSALLDKHDQVRSAYKNAWDLAEQDNVQLRDLPQAA